MYPLSLRYTQLLQPRLRRVLAVLVLGLLVPGALAQGQQPASSHAGNADKLRQAPAPPHIATGSTTADTSTSSTRYYAEEMPTLNGRGYQAIVAYIQKRAVWPKNGGMICAQGRVFVRFTVGADGLLFGFKVIKGLDPLLDAEALRAARTLLWLQPARSHGQPVAVTLTVPVSFDNK